MNGKRILVAALLFLGLASAWSQVDPRISLYRAEPKGNIKYRREGTMDGNLVRTLFYNNGEVGQWPNQPSGEWPKGTGHSYLDGVTVLIGAKVIAANGRSITPIEASYREEMDKDPVTGEIWGLEPVPGYFSIDLNADGKINTKPAINKDPQSFPKEWPAALGLTPEWNGFWYGYFGRGVTNADFETFFVMDDSKDGEYKRAPFSYYPIAADSGRGGLGLRVEVRGFQWSHVLAEDIIFWHYDIVNISDHNYDSTCFGFYTDAGVGGTNNNGNSALFDRKLDLTYAWAPSGLGVPGNWKTGYYGYAYLESPGNGTNGIDDDEDGMIDERRDDDIDNDHDWTGYSDLNGNGKWDIDEPLNDDLGKDGVGPFDPQYTGPDEGEADGKPTHGEPNFDETDKDESDQIGLNAISVYILADKGPTGGWPKNDDVMWKKMTGGFRDTTVQNTNISMVFSSGPFPLAQGRRERFSMALVFGNDLQDLVFNKETVQSIYNANYNFSQPPLTPHATFVPGDGKVFIYWDNIAEKSYDRFLKKFDFEGYAIYRSEDAQFQDAKIVTDANGDPKYWKPIARFDLVDSIKGPDPVGINGAHYYRGDDTGLEHSFVDKDVKNGMRYYYAIVSYDKGDPSRGTGGLQPTECTKIITEDYAGSIRFIDINCGVVTPNAAAAGYVPPQIDGNLAKVNTGLGTGNLSVTVLNPTQIVEGTTYKVKFNATGTVPTYTTTSYDIIRSRAGGADTTILRNLSAAVFGVDKASPPFDGLVVAFRNDTVVTVNDTATGWLVGKSNVIMRATPDGSNAVLNVRWPADYEIRFGADGVDTSAFNIPPAYPKMPVNFSIYNTTTGDKVKFIIFDLDGSKTLTFGDTIRIIDGYESQSKFKIPWKVSWGRPWGPTTNLPEPGDRFVIKTRRPFANGDFFQFVTRAPKTDQVRASSDLARIAVVPNPYIAAARWERPTLYQTGRGDRKIDFINLPAQCTIRIYTITGGLVKTLSKNSAPTDGSLSWNMVSEDGLDIAYGLYIYHVDAPGIGEQIGKFAVVK